MAHKLILVTAVLVAATGTASAQSLDDAARAKLKTCAAQSSDLARLACFDQAFPKISSNTSSKTSVPPNAPAAMTAMSPQPGTVKAASPTVKDDETIPDKLNLSVPDDQKGWVVRRARSPLDHSLTVAAVLRATKTTIARLASSGLKEQAAMVVICRDHKTDFYIGYTDIVDGMEKIPVQYRVGNKPPASAHWGISQDFMSYGIWHNAETKPFILSLVNAGSFFVRGNPGPMGISEAAFDLAGMDAAIAPVRKACGW